MKKKLLNIYRIWQLFLLVCLSFMLCEARAENQVVTIIAGSQMHEFSVEVARTPSEKAHGLMGRKTLSRRKGMLFVHRPAQRVSMWMKNTFIDLDMLFVDDKHMIINIAEAKAGDESRITPYHPVQYVLEIRGGIAKKLGIRAGHTIQLAHP
jgi:uncharacterized membrane protein (UPF0127 family)